MEKYQYHIFSPYRVSPLGAHVNHQHGLVTGFAIVLIYVIFFGLLCAVRILRYLCEQYATTM